MSRAATVALLGAAAAAWLSGGTAGSAATAPQTQGVAAAVKNTISWGSAGACVQNMPTAAFGELAAGASNTLSGFRGCVTSNRRWGVAVRMSTPLKSTDDDSTIDGSAMKVATTTPPGGAVNNCTTASPCTLSADPAVDTTMFANARRPENQFDYSLTLTAPSTATGGAYTDGQLTFTASN